ncbi:hypothetical protein N7481_000261 [Penicillium waksmanii]|uniref:uncharacterized protein n=1 Tax=Penicillium waksmanii TaxID=69791 RepID=UPI0025478BB7|nr:uncharacterized protein N7481_000261 [Penicillium waksmanii]KAJ5999852.1 hypothetical protein N7481_000261 [Penicillium waksmanii]
MSSLQSPVVTVPTVPQCEYPEILQKLERVIIAWTWTDTIAFCVLAVSFMLIFGFLTGLINIFVDFTIAPYIRRFFDYLFGGSSNYTNLEARQYEYEYCGTVRAPVDRPHNLRVVQAEGQNRQSDQKRSKDDIDATLYLFMDNFENGGVRNEISFKAVFYVKEKDPGVEKCN